MEEEEVLDENIPDWAHQYDGFEENPGAEVDGAVEDNDPKRHVVLPGTRKIVGVEDKTDEDYDQFDGQPPFAVTIDPSILLSKEDTPYSRNDHSEGTLMRRKYVRKTVT
jgi:hypothetical protein